MTKQKAEGLITLIDERDPLFLDALKKEEALRKQINGPGASARAVDARGVLHPVILTPEEVTELVEYMEGK